MSFPDDPKERERMLLNEVVRGNVQPCWSIIKVLDRAVKVTTAPLAWDGVHYGVSCATQQRIADEFGAYLPTVRISDCMSYEAHTRGALAPVKPQPVIGMNSTATMERFSKEIQKHKPAANMWLSGGKDWIAYPERLLRSKTTAVNYGWHVPASKSRWIKNASGTSTVIDLNVVQNVGQAHSIHHSDYSQLVRLWAPIDPADLDHLLEGCFRRHPGVSRPTKVQVPPTPKVTPKRTSYGSRGPAVVAWQDHLNELGYGPLTEDGIHGTLTERASRRWDADHAGAEPKKSGSPWREQPNPLADSFVQSRDFTRGRPNWASCRGVCIHTAEMVESSTAAERLRDWTASGRANVSWHYAVDSDTVTQSVLEQDSAWTAGPGNDEFIHIEIAGYARQSDGQWADEFSEAALNLAAEVVADVLVHYGLEARKLTAQDILDKESGVCGHVDISDASLIAYRERRRELPWWDPSRRVPRRTTNHRDPGKNFPWESFLDKVRSLMVGRASTRSGE